MSKQGSLLRMKKYKAAGNTKNLELEQAFYEKHYGSLKDTETKSTSKKK